MNKYELAVVVSAKLEDDARTATVEKVKEYITRFGGTITNVDEWGKKKLAYDIQKMSEGFYYFIQFDAEATCPAELAKQGKGIIMISSEMPELIGMSDRILVMSHGKIVGELERTEYTQERILELASTEKEGVEEHE